MEACGKVDKSLVKGCPKLGPLFAGVMQIDFYMHHKDKIVKLHHKCDMIFFTKEFKAVLWHLGKHAEEWTKQADECRAKSSLCVIMYCI